MAASWDGVYCPSDAVVWVCRSAGQVIKTASSILHRHNADDGGIVVAVGGEAGLFPGVLDAEAGLPEGLGQLVQHKKTAVVVVVEKGVALQRLPLAVERVMDAAHLDEELSARLEGPGHAPQEHPLLLLVDGVDGKAAVGVVIALRLVEGVADEVAAYEPGVWDRLLPEHADGRLREVHRHHVQPQRGKVEGVPPVAAPQLRQRPPRLHQGGHIPGEGGGAGGAELD